MFYLLIVLVSILPVGFGEGRFWDKGSEEDLVYENLGLKAEKIGMISLVDDHALISVVIKLPNFKASIKPASNKERGLIDACCGDFLDHDLGKSRGIPASQSTFQILFKENYLKLIRSYQLRADKFLESRMNILEPYVLPSQLIRHARRSKRQLLAFLGSTVLSFAMGAVSEYQMYKINQHINSNSEAIKDLKLRLDQEQKMIIALKNGIIGISREITSKLEVFLERNSCTQLFSDLSNRFEFTFHEYTHIVDELLFTIIDGHSRSLLSPRTIGPEVIEQLILQHSELNNTVFFENPLLLYSSAKVNVANIDNKLEFAHFVLDVPLLYRNDTSYKLFRPSQVGIFISNDTCAYYEIPKLMYDRQGVFIEVRDLDECTQHNALFICPSSTVFKIKSCIQRTQVTCNYHRDNCDYHYSYKMSTVGVLLRDNLDHDAFVLDDTGRTNLLNFPPHRTAYVPWNEVQALQIGDAILSSPHIPRDPISMVNLSSHLTPFDFVDSKEVSKVFGDICEKYNSSLSELITPVISESQANKFLSWEFLWLISLTISIIGLMTWLSWRQISVCRGVTTQPKSNSLPLTNQEAPSSPEMENSPPDLSLNRGGKAPPEYTTSSISC